MTVKAKIGPEVSPWMTKGEAALYLRVTPSTIDRYVNEKMLTRYTVRGVQSARFARSELAALVVPDTDHREGVATTTGP